MECKQTLDDRATEIKEILRCSEGLIQSSGESYIEGGYRPSDADQVKFFRYIGPSYKIRYVCSSNIEGDPIIISISGLDDTRLLSAAWQDSEQDWGVHYYKEGNWREELKSDCASVSQRQAVGLA